MTDKSEIKEVQLSDIYRDIGVLDGKMSGMLDSVKALERSIQQRCDVQCQMFQSSLNVESQIRMGENRATVERVSVLENQMGKISTKLVKIYAYITCAYFAILTGAPFLWKLLKPYFAAWAHTKLNGNTISTF